MKRFLSCFLCVLLILSFAVTASAEGESNLQVFDCDWNSSGLNVLLYAKTGDELSKDNFSVTLNGTQLPVTGFDPYEKTDYGTSWIIVVEPMRNSGTEQNAVQDIVYGLYSKLGKNDTVAVIDAGSGRMENFTSRAETMDYVKDCLTGHGEVKLYDAIYSALSSFSTETSYRPRKNLLILTRGIDKSSSYSFDILRKEAEKTSAAIYTVGLVRSSTDRRIAFNGLNDLVYSGKGGLAIPMEDPIMGDTYQKVLDEITENEKNCYMLNADAKGITAQIEASLLVVLQSGNLRLESRMNVPIVTPPECQHEWQDATCTAPRTCSICGATEGEALGHDFSKAGLFKRGVCSRCGEVLPSGMDKAFSWMGENLIIVILIAVLLALLIVMLILLLKRKKALKRAEKERIAAEAAAAEAGNTVPAAESVTSPTKQMSKLTILLNSMKSGVVYEGEIFDKTVVAGRTAQMRIIDDPSISREQMEFIWESGILYVLDNGSTNGTWVNGREIKGMGPIPLHQNDIIHAGDTDFVVTWRTNR